MKQDIEGVYSRMYRAMDDHKQGLISFHDMLQLWKDEARLIRECHAKGVDDELNVQVVEAA